MSFSAWLSSSRKAQSISQAVLAAKLGVTQAQVSQWETGKAEPKPEHMAKLEKRRMTLPQKLKDTFCYLLDAEEVFDLGPLAFAHHDAQMARHEVFVARKISGFERGDKVEGSAVSGPSGAKLGVG
jgi:transcriptional regulator with XRE-family HTH domain